jgi:3-phosphoshikimate 1-carboxyvinyltransferase
MMAIEGIKNEKIKGGDRSSAKESEDSTKEEAHTAEIELLGLFAHSYQGDSRGAEVFTRLGVHTEYTDRGVKLTGRVLPPPVSTKTWWTSRTWRRPLSSPAA